MYRLDRLTETWSSKSTYWHTCGDEVARSGQLRLVSRIFCGDHEEPSRTLIGQILGVIAEYERSMISLRLRRGRAQGLSVRLRLR